MAGDKGCKLPLHDGQFAIVDAADFDWLNQWKWRAIFRSGFEHLWYAVRTSCGAKGKRLYLRMHRVIMEPPPGMFIDHINGNGLDNRRSNLRICTLHQNAGNSRKARHGVTSKFRGVSMSKGDKQWKAQIKRFGKQAHLGRFNSEIEAAKAYDAAARNHFGEFARLNFPDADRRKP